jgi:hypothetical protein
LNPGTVDLPGNAIARCGFGLPAASTVKVGKANGLKCMASAPVRQFLTTLFKLSYAMSVGSNHKFASTDLLQLCPRFSCDSTLPLAIVGHE